MVDLMSKIYARFEQNRHDMQSFIMPHILKGTIGTLDRFIFFVPYVTLSIQYNDYLYKHNFTIIAKHEVDQRSRVPKGKNLRNITICNNY